MVRYCVAFAAVVLLSNSALAGGKAKPNALTQEEVRDGWILLFDGETTFGWTGEKWKVERGELVSPGKDSPIRSTAEFVDFDLDFECKSDEKVEAVLGFGKYSERDSHPVRIYLRGHDPRGWQKVRLRVEGVDAGGIIESPEKKKATYPEAVIRESPGMPVPLVFKGESLRLRNIKLKPRNLKSLFNGKDLDGWKVHPGKKSKFSVTEEGWLNVKDGPGDVQTVGKYRDFILQLECISHGKHLNSGIFFRCIPDQYQQGYEAQIRNEFTPGKTRTYTVEMHDPKTHKNSGTVKVESDAVDFGTGAIYRRMPARKQMSKDGEWFTMTVVAHGRHFATWVNGVQVVDWTDHRPLNDNARQGCCLNAGPLSIQGHDPTTNLSFRNLRIAEFPAAKRD